MSAHNEQTPVPKKKGLVIGINYRRWEDDPELAQYVLESCVLDAQRAKDFLVNTCGYESCDIRTLEDSAEEHDMMPTKENIIRSMEWLVEDAKPGDRFFLHYSGHGGQVQDDIQGGDEIDGMDEVIWPVDGTDTSGHIKDDVMWEVLVSQLPSGCQLTAMFDCCHAGTMLDLPLVYDAPSGKIKHKSRLMHQQKLRHSLADVVSWASCKDSEISLETLSNADKLTVASGAMTAVFYDTLRVNPHMSYMSLFVDIRNGLKPMRQRPQLSTALEAILDQKMLLI